MRYVLCVLILFLIACDDTWGPYPDPMHRHTLVGRVSDGSAAPVVVGLTVRTTIVAPLGQAEKYGDCVGVRVNQRLDGVDTHGNFNAALEVYRWGGPHCVFVEVLETDRVIANKTIPEINFGGPGPRSTDVIIPLSN